MAIHKHLYAIPFWSALYLIMRSSMAADSGFTSPGVSSGTSPMTNRPPSPTCLSDPWAYLTSFEFVLSLLVVMFGICTIFIEYLLLRSKSFNANDMLRVVAITIIIFGTLFVITAGFSSQQIAPAVGLFGTIAGYLLGRSSGHNEKMKDV